MAKKMKRSQAMSESSDEEKFDGNTTPHGPAARGKTHQGGNSKGTCTQRSVSPPVTSQSTTGQPATGICPMDKKTVQNGRSLVTGHRSNWHYTSIFKSVNHRSPAIQPPVIGLRKYQHRSKNSPVTGQPVTGHQNLYQPTFSETHAMGMEFANNNNSKKSFIIPGTRL